MRNFLDRESARVEYISKREKDRTAEVKQRQAQIEAAELKVSALAEVRYNGRAGPFHLGMKKNRLR